MPEAFRKPFLTIIEQVSLLESRGLSTDAATARVLMREGYYSIVNGYKDPFIDSEATDEAGDDRYLSGATFSDLYDLVRHLDVGGRSDRAMGLVGDGEARPCRLGRGDRGHRHDEGALPLVPTASRRQAYRSRKPRPSRS